jgi:preprotein translocase subunit SecG
MSFVIGILTFILVLLCMLLILLVLVQLPKKDAGVGLAFGGGAADALFGSGSGNTLTKITKYTAVGFLALSLLLNLMEGGSRPDTSASSFTKAVEQKQQQSASTPPPQQQKPQTAPPINQFSSMIPTNAPPPPPVANTNSAK